MQRIDENTYIDNTLVTCAEYQLFVDEMREQAKYYQPDHWAFFQFLQGQAYQPILGVRFQDAKEFCQWLSQNQTGEWGYRLPTSGEMEQNPLDNCTHSLCGCWATEQNDAAEFRWTGASPINPRKIDLKITLDLTFNRDVPLIPDVGLNPEIFQALGLPRDIHIDRALNIDDAVNLALALAKTMAGSQKRTVYRDQDFLVKFKVAITRVVNRANAMHRDYDIQLGDDRANDLADALDMARQLVNYRPRRFAQARVMDSNRSAAFYLYLDLYTLQERIAGRSPAFEGIRLVKERIQ